MMFRKALIKENFCRDAIYGVRDTMNVPILGARTRYIASLQVSGLIYATYRKRQVGDIWIRK